LKLLIDIDGVVRNITKPCIDIYKTYYNPQSTIIESDILLYEMESLFPEIVDLPGIFFGKFAKEVFLDLSKPYPQAIEIINELYLHHDIHIVTHQFKGNEIYTLQWLEKYGLMYNSISFTSDKNNIFGEFAIDDSIDMLNKYKTAFPICMSRPWNKDWQGVTVSDMKEFKQYLDNLE